MNQACFGNVKGRTLGEVAGYFAIGKTF